MILLILQVAAEVVQHAPPPGDISDTLQLGLSGGSAALLAYVIRELRALSRVEAKVDVILDPDNGLSARVARLERWRDLFGRRAYDPLPVPTEDVP